MNTTMKILIIEDDERIASPVREELEHQCYVVDIAVEGNIGLEMARTGDYDIILLDLMLPVLDGFSICKQLREEGNSSAILMLTARGEKHDKISGLDSGADDYITKPFDLDELSARIRALSRRSGTQRKTLINCGRLQIDTALCQVLYEETIVDLTPTEYRILLHFARNPGAIFNGEELIERLWSSNESPGRETIKTHMKTLRKKLASAGGNKDVIETVYGFGYRLKT